MEQRQLNVIGTNMIWLTIWQMFIWEGIVWQVYTLTVFMSWGTLLEEGRLREQKGLWGYGPYWGFLRSIRWPEFFSSALAMNGREREVVCEASDSGTAERGHKGSLAVPRPKGASVVLQSSSGMGLPAVSFVSSSGSRITLSCLWTTEESLCLDGLCSSGWGYLQFLFCQCHLLETRDVPLTHILPVPRTRPKTKLNKTKKTHSVTATSIFCNFTSMR